MRVAAAFAAVLVMFLLPLVLLLLLLLMQNFMWAMSAELVVISFSIRVQTVNALFFASCVQPGERKRMIDKKKKKRDNGNKERTER